MDQLFVHVSFWWPLGIGALLMTGELLVPATVFLWTGISCVLVAGLIALVPDLSLVTAVGLWIALSAGTILVVKYLQGHRLTGERVAPSAPPNRYGAEFVGMTTTLQEDSAEKHVRVNLKGANWGVMLPGGDLKAGTKIRITAVEGIYLIGESAEGAVQAGV
jgi:membrane protein implicated in regulation of membrane protease activity